MRKIFTLLSLLVAFSMALAACGGGAAAPGVVIKETVIVEVPGAETPMEGPKTITASFGYGDV
ncbi:MAG: hypothetical protein MUO77_06235, partial [Anaerolineales bacterium]|nr:hypothetical protein [Anaerolineales bacterium]